LDDPAADFEGAGAPRRVRRGRGKGPDLPPGGNRRGHGLHGGTGGGEVPRRSGSGRSAESSRMSEQRKPPARPPAPPLPQSKGMDWDKLRVFHAVAEAGSFTHAGESLNLSQSAVSRQISALEEPLPLPLFHRHARGLILTEQGDLLYRTAREVFAKLAMTEAMLSESKDRPKGPLKVTTTVAFGSAWLVPRIREFLELYPEIQLSVVVDDSELDLSMRD